MNTKQWWFVIHGSAAAGRVSGDLYSVEDRARQRLAELSAAGVDARLARITGQMEIVQ